MRILCSGLLLGSGIFAACYGYFTRVDGQFLNGQFVLGLACMSLGLFALRTNMESEEDQAQHKSPYPAEYQPPG